MQPTNAAELVVVCSPKKECLIIISAYVPSPEKWESDWKTRKIV